MDLPSELKTRLNNFSIREKSIVKVEVNSFSGVIVKVDEGYYVVGNAIAKKIEVRDDQGTTCRKSQHRKNYAI